MVNFGLNAAAILGLFLAVAGAGLFFLRSIRPELARDYDIFFAAVGLLCGIILLFNGWRLDPILQFGQFLLTGTAIFFAFESIRMRSVATEQARRNTPTVDRDRPVSRTRVYTDAELDQIDPYEDAYDGAEPNYSSPRLRGYDDPQPRSPRRSESRRRPSSMGDIREEPRRRQARNRPETRNYGDRPVRGERYPERDDQSNRRRRPSSTSADGYDERISRDEWSDESIASSRPRNRSSREDIYTQPTATTSTSRRRPNPADLGRSYEPEDNDDLDNNYDDSDMGRSYENEEQSIPGDYVVDYQPLDETDSDYSDDYDDSYQDDYDNYKYDDRVDDNSVDSNSRDSYNNYGDRSDNRKPINFNDR